MATLLCLIGLGLFGHFHEVGSDLVEQRGHLRVPARAERFYTLDWIAGWR
jgi:hypothetical protein